VWRHRSDASVSEEFLTGGAPTLVAETPDAGLAPRSSARRQFLSSWRQGGGTRALEMAALKPSRGDKKCGNRVALKPFVRIRKRSVMAEFKSHEPVALLAGRDGM